MSIGGASNPREGHIVNTLHGPGWISSGVDFDSNTTQKDSQDGQCPTAQRSEIQRAGLMYILEMGWCIL